MDFRKIVLWKEVMMNGHSHALRALRRSQALRRRILRCLPFLPRGHRPPHARYWSHLPWLQRHWQEGLRLRAWHQMPTLPWHWLHLSCTRPFHGTHSLTEKDARHFLARFIRVAGRLTGSFLCYNITNRATLRSLALIHKNSTPILRHNLYY